MIFTIHGAPRTKKNSQRIVRPKGGGSPFIIQGKPHDAWSKTAILQLRAQAGGAAAAAAPMNLRARIYRERRTGDLGNFLAAVCDALERAGVVENDKWILGFDGSRLLVDRHIPRVELELTPLEASA